MNLEQFKALCAQHQLTVHAKANARYSANRQDGKNALHQVSFRQAGGIGRQAYFSVSPRAVRLHEVAQGAGGHDVWTFNGIAYTLTKRGHVGLMDVINAGQFQQVLAVLREG